MSNQPLATVTTLLILGASGDLTSRLLLPGLGSLLACEPDRRVQVIGADRADLSDHDWSEKLRTALQSADAPAEVVERVLDSSRYVRADLLQGDEIDRLLDSVSGPLVLYFALPPQVTVQVCALLEQKPLPDQTRLALEKPFGHDLASAQELNAQLLKVVGEERIHRVDHFLGVNTVLNLLGLRFSNRLLQPVWSTDHIERVDITYDETLALEGRAGYYDRAGALVDMLQSHLLQVLSFFAMEPPSALTATEVRPLKEQLLRATQVRGDDPTASSRRGRYTAGTLGDRQVPDYVAEDGVDPALDTETLAEVSLEINNGRWSGVPFVLRSGKALGRAVKEIVVTFRPPKHLPTGMVDTDRPDRLVLELKPGAISLELSINAEGDAFALEPKTMRAELGHPRMTPYGEVLAGILDDDQLLSISADVAEECWRIVEPVLAAWRADDVPLQDYPAGSNGFN